MANAINHKHVIYIADLSWKLLAKQKRLEIEGVEGYLISKNQMYDFGEKKKRKITKYG